jgi:O-antigen ligase
VTPELVAVVGACVLAYAATAVWDARLPRLVLTTILAGLLIANKSFATIGAGEIYIMDVGLALAVLGIMLHPVTRARLAGSRLPLLTLAAFLVLGIVSLLRGTEYGVLAVKDSVINFYAVALLLPVALFPTYDAAARFLRRMLIPLVIGSVVFSVVQVMSLGGANPPFGLDLTNATVTAAAAAGLSFVIFDRQPFTAGRILIALLLAATVAVGLARSVWVGCLLAALVLWAVAHVRDDRARWARATVVGGIVACALVTVLAFTDTRANRILQAELASLAFRASDDSADNPIGNARWRLTAWNDLVHGRIADNPLVGEGFGRPALETSSVSAPDERVQVHNGYLTYLLREGIAGLSLFLLLVGSAVVRCVRTARFGGEGRERAFALAVLGALCVYLGNIAFAVIIEGPMSAIPFWLLIGVALALPDLGRETSVQAAPATSGPFPALRPADA